MIKYSFGKPCNSKTRISKRNMKWLRHLTRNSASEDGLIYIDTRCAPFELGGILRPEDNGNEYYRLDSDKRETYSDANRGLGEHTAGGTIRFTTTANEMGVRIYNRSSSTGMHHFCDRGAYGIDIYVGTGTNRKYVGNMMQTFADSPNYNSGKVWLGEGTKEVQINLPLYGGIEKLELGFYVLTKLGAPTPRTNGAIAFYGSSITQGGCVSRPANSYANIICRALDSDCCNFGFSGSAMGELEVARCIASRDISCFVMDYDYNSPSAETLKATHEPFFREIRAAKPELPVVFVTHPYYSDPTENDLARVAVVKETYEKALANGDNNVYFVDSASFFTKEMRDLYSVDNLHPNDLGQFSMAEAIFPAVKKALENAKK